MARGVGSHLVDALLRPPSDRADVHQRMARLEARQLVDVQPRKRGARGGPGLPRQALARDQERGGRTGALAPILRRAELNWCSIRVGPTDVFCGPASAPRPKPLISQALPAGPPLAPERAMTLSDQRPRILVVDDEVVIA